MKPEVCCLPRVSEPVAIFEHFFLSQHVNSEAQGESQPCSLLWGLQQLLHCWVQLWAAVSCLWKLLFPLTASISSRGLMGRAGLLSWSHKFPSVGRSCHIEYLKIWTPTCSSITCHRNRMEQGLSGFNSTPAGLNLLSKPAQDVRAESSALHLKKFPWKCQVWGFGCRNGVEWCCSVLVHLEISGSAVGGECGALGWVWQCLCVLWWCWAGSSPQIPNLELFQLRLNWTSPFPAVVPVGASPNTNYKISTCLRTKSPLQSGFVPQGCSVQLWLCSRSQKELPFWSINIKGCGLYRVPWSSLVLVTWWKSFVFWSGSSGGKELVLTQQFHPTFFSLHSQCAFFSLHQKFWGRNQ